MYLCLVDCVPVAAWKGVCLSQWRSSTTPNSSSSTNPQLESTLSWEAGNMAIISLIFRQDPETIELMESTHVNKGSCLHLLIKMTSWHAPRKRFAYYKISSISYKSCLEPLCKLMSVSYKNLYFSCNLIMQRKENIFPGGMHSCTLFVEPNNSY